jgi:hypothetical protein
MPNMAWPQCPNMTSRLIALGIAALTPTYAGCCAIGNGTIEAGSIEAIDIHRQQAHVDSCVDAAGMRIRSRRAEGEEQR